MNKELEQKLPKLPKDYFWRISKAPGYRTSRDIYIMKKFLGSSLLANSVITSSVHLYSAESTVENIINEANRLFVQFSHATSLEEVDGDYIV